GVGAVRAPPAGIIPGDSFPVIATVTNQGTGDVGASTTKFYLVSVANGSRKNLNGVQTVPPLPAGQSAAPPATVVLFSDTALGTYRLQACADGGGDLSESDETDNCTTSAGTPPAAARPHPPGIPTAAPP